MGQKNCRSVKYYTQLTISIKDWKFRMIFNGYSEFAKLFSNTPSSFITYHLSNFRKPKFSTSSKGEIRNIEVPDREFSRSSQSVSPVRPVTAPARSRRQVRQRSPSHPNYKEEAYLQSSVVLRYVGHTDHYTRLESRARHRAHRKSQRLPPLPAHVDEVTIEQQPRGSYVLEVFHGYLAVGGQCQMSNFVIWPSFNVIWMTRNADCVKIPNMKHNS